MAEITPSVDVVIYSFSDTVFLPAAIADSSSNTPSCCCCCCCCRDFFVCSLDDLVA